MLLDVVCEFLHRKRESNQTPGWPLPAGCGAPDGSQVTRFGIIARSLSDYPRARRSSVN